MYNCNKFLEGKIDMFVHAYNILTETTQGKYFNWVKLVDQMN